MFGAVREALEGKTIVKEIDIVYPSVLSVG